MRKHSSLTILDYIREQIQILMQMKCEEDKASNGNRDKHLGRFGVGENNGAASEFTSTFQSLDLANPP